MLLQRLGKVIENGMITVFPRVTQIVVKLSCIGQPTTHTRRSNPQNTPALSSPKKSTRRTPFGFRNGHDGDLAGVGASHPFAPCSWL